MRCGRLPDVATPQAPDRQDSLGRVRLAAGDPPGAGDSLSVALEIFRATGGRSGEGWALTHYAALLPPPATSRAPSRSTSRPWP
jgi:hypothetical protein